MRFDRTAGSGHEMGRVGLGRIILTGAVLAALVWWGTPYLQHWLFAATTPRAVEPRGNLADFEQTTVALFKRASPSVVQVVVPRADSSHLGEPTEATPGLGT